MKTELPTRMDKCKGAMVATAIGDAMGWPNELRAKNVKKNPIATDNFIEWSRRCSKPCWHTEKILPGEYSDDTQLTLSVARSIISGNWEDQFAKKELPFWLTYERGGGGALLRSARSHKNGVLPWQSKYAADYFDAGGNGAAMRILPHVIANAYSSSLSDLMPVVIRDTFMTHGHPRAVLGATCYAFALDYLLKKESVLEYGELVDALIESCHIWGALPDSTEFAEWFDCARVSAHYKYFDEWNHSVNEMINQLQYVKSALNMGVILEDSSVLAKLNCFGKANGAGDITILGAVYLASKYANNPTLGIKIPAFLIGTDTDTLASITGGLLGMLCGTAWIPAVWRDVQDYECLLQITELLLAPNRKEVSKKIVSEAKKNADVWENTPIGWIRKLSAAEYEAGKDRLISISKYQSALGQTFYIKEYRSVDWNAEEQMLIYAQHGVQSKTGECFCVENKAAADSDKAYNEFAINISNISELLEQAELKHRTFGKILQLIRAILLSGNSAETIAKEFRVDIHVVNTLIKYFK